MTDTPTVVDHTADEFRMLPTKADATGPPTLTTILDCVEALSTKAEQNENRGKENRQRILTLEQALSRSNQRREEIDNRLEQHGKTLQAHGNTLAAVRTVADKAHADQALHELNHTRVYDHDYAKQAQRLALLETNMIAVSTLAAALAKRLGITISVIEPGQAEHN